MKVRTKLLMLAAVLALSAAAVTGCGDDDEDDDGDAAGDGAGATVVEVTLREFEVHPDKDTVKAGSITFKAKNEGDEVHELVVLKTELDDGELPVVESKVDEDAAGEVIGEIEEFAAGGAEEATFELESGSYVLLCNIVETEESGELESHYEEGMHTSFTVE